MPASFCSVNSSPSSAHATSAVKTGTRFTKTFARFAPIARMPPLRKTKASDEGKIPR